MVIYRADNICFAPTRSCGAWVLPAIFALLLSSITTASDLFLPNDFVGSNVSHSPVDNKLSNEELAERAEALRDQSLSITQRALNHQWMSQYQHSNNVEGSKAFSRLFKRGFKKYWDQKRKTDFANKDYIPNSDGKGKVKMGGDIDYDVRVSSNKINLGLTYEF